VPWVFLQLLRLMMSSTSSICNELWWTMGVRTWLLEWTFAVITCVEWARDCQARWDPSGYYIKTIQLCRNVWCLPLRWI
jgi:hypothetical protein